MTTATASAIEFKAHHVRNPMKAKSDNWQETADRWLVSVNGQEFDYYTGIGHRIKGGMPRANGWTYEELKVRTLTDAGIKSFCEVSRAKPPTLDDVLYSLLSDASAADVSFEDWCSDFGYDEDSRKALDLYHDCQKIAGKLRKAKINVAAERERLADY